MFCTYNTIYTGDKMPPFYIGYTSVEKIKKGYHGSVASKQYRQIWREELKNNPRLFETTILAVYETQEEAIVAERKLLESVQAHKNPSYINMTISNEKFFQPQKHSSRKEVYRNYYLRNKDKVNKRCRKYNEVNYDKVKAASYYQQNKEKVLERCRLYWKRKNAGT